MQAEKTMPDLKNATAVRQAKFRFISDYVRSREKTLALVQADAQVPFAPRTTDTFIATYPKCGTTWMMQIVHQLRTGGSMQFPEIYAAVVPFFDLGGFGSGHRPGSAPGRRTACVQDASGMGSDSERGSLHLCLTRPWRCIGVLLPLRQRRFPRERCHLHR